MKRELPFNGKPLIMGILNVTPDSFFDGEKYFSREKAIEHARALISDGADIIDVGGESTRPFAAPVDLSEEIRRVLPVVEGIRSESDIPISVDTSKAEVANLALDAGADIVNDISGFSFDRGMVEVVRDRGAYAVIMHIKGTPGTMQVDPVYDDVIGEIKMYFTERLSYATDRGVSEDRIILDPGIGFGKRVEDNLKIIKTLHSFKVLGRPLLVGTSMKSFIGAVTGSPLEERFAGTLASVALSVWNGANIVRVHDVKATRKVIDFVNAVRNA